MLKNAVLWTLNGRSLVVTLNCWGSFHIEGSWGSTACTVLLGRNLLCVHLGLSAIRIGELAVLIISFWSPFCVYSLFVSVVCNVEMGQSPQMDEKQTGRTDVAFVQSSSLLVALDVSVEELCCCSSVLFCSDRKGNQRKTPNNLVIHYVLDFSLRVKFPLRYMCITIWDSVNTVQWTNEPNPVKPANTPQEIVGDLTIPVALPYRTRRIWSLSGRTSSVTFFLC